MVFFLFALFTVLANLTILNMLIGVLCGKVGAFSEALSEASIEALRSR